MEYVIGIAIVVGVILFLVFSGKKKPALETPAAAPELSRAAKPHADVAPAQPPVPKAESKRPSAPAPAAAAETSEIAAVDSAQVVAPATEEPPPVLRPLQTEALRRSLSKSRDEGGFFSKLRALFVGRDKISAELWTEIEEVLLTSDVGTKTTERLIAALRKADPTPDAVWAALQAEAVQLLGSPKGGLQKKAQPTVVLVVGVNGAGKTTTIGKLATQLTKAGHKVVLAAGDTFRAAAVQQLEIWAKRTGADFVRGADGASSPSVLFDAVERAKASGADFVLADTAGRLHTKVNLMEELKKCARSIEKALPGAPHETLLVLDATTGQNALQQAALFAEALPLTGIALTKLDGTAKGGVVLAIAAERDVPVRYIGCGERPEDLRDFIADEFVEALLGTKSVPASAAA